MRVFSRTTQPVEELVAELVDTVVDPILRRIVRPPSREVHEELRAEVVLRIAARLNRPGDREPIASLPDYVAVMTYHAHVDYLRGAFPERVRLKDRLRYVLRRDRRFETD